MIRILGIDPGYETVGWGVLDFENMRFGVVKYGYIRTSSHTPFEKRLSEIYDDMCSILDKFRPDCMSIEKLFFNSNITTGIDVAHARGVIMLAATQRNVKIYEYTPLQVKHAVTGYGHAKKHQVQEMVKNILHVTEDFKRDDTADALALAICHGHSGGSRLTEIIRGNEVTQLNRPRKNKE